MKTIYKYPLKNNSVQHIMAPLRFVPRSVGVQDHEIMLWAEVETRYPQITHTIEIFGTGHTIPEDMGVERAYIGTTQLHGFVWHVYHRTN